MKVNPLQKVVTVNSLGHYKPSKVYYTHVLLAILIILHVYTTKNIFQTIIFLTQWLLVQQLDDLF